MNVRQYLSKTTTMILLCLMTSCLAYGNGSGDSIATDTVMLGIKADTTDRASGIRPAALKARHDTTATPQYLRRVGRIQRGWNAIVPNLSIFQYAGGIGMLSIGTGWDYGRRDQWETYLMLGYTPRHNTPDEYFTLSLKETYTPWSIPLWRDARLAPLFVSLTVSTLLNGEFWVKNPTDTRRDTTASRARYGSISGWGRRYGSATCKTAPTGSRTSHSTMRYRRRICISSRRYATSRYLSEISFASLWAYSIRFSDTHRPATS